jgi:serine/threonine protein kinase
MALPSVEAFLELVRKSGVVDPTRISAYLESLRAANQSTSEPTRLSELMVRDGVLTQFQTEQFLAGKWRGFFVGKYKILERLGAGGMGTVYLAEHKFMKRRVAIKVLPKSKAKDSSSLERFYREAKAIAALDHPNIVRAYDIDYDADGDVHFLVMEYVDGASLQEIIKAHGPMAIDRVANYMAQSALALQHAHEIGLVHRDIKPGNILIDRTGVVKVLDMGLARFFHDHEDMLTRKYDENVLGTADYLAPEQALDSHTVDIRADIYGLGCTFYFVLTAKSPFGEGTVAQKLIWHQTRKPKPLREWRPDVPEELNAVLDKMMAKSPNDRYQRPGEVVEALAPLNQTPIPPPPLEEMPNLCVAAGGAPAPETLTGGSSLVSSAPTALRKPASSVTRTEGSPPAVGGSGVRHPPADIAARASTGGVLNITKSGGGPRTDPAIISAPGGSAGRSGNGAGSASHRKSGGPEGRIKVRGLGPADPQSPLEDVSPFQSFNDTTDPSNFSEDTVRSGRRKRRGDILPAGSKWQDPVYRRNAIIVGAVAGSVLLLALVAVIVYFGFIRGTSDPSSGGLEGETRSDRPGVKPGVIHVSKRKVEAGDLESITEALQRANAGDRIIIRDTEVYEERIEILAGTGKRGISIEAERDDEGKSATLRASTNLPAGEPLVNLDRTDSFKLKGFNLDGARRCDELIRISGNCPGSVFEDLRLRGFNRRGIQLESVNGLPRREVVLRNLVLEPDRDKGVPAQVAIFFNQPPRFPGVANSNILVQGCRFLGPYDQAVSIRTPVHRIVFERNVFFRCGKQGIVYPADAPPDLAIDLRLENNTFTGLDSGLELQQQISILDSTILLQRNLFYQVRLGIVLVRPDMAEKLAAVIRGESNYFDKSVSKPGNLSDATRLALGLQLLDFHLPIANPLANDFLRFKKTSPLALQDKQFVGALEPLP